MLLLYSLSLWSDEYNYPDYNQLLSLYNETVNTYSQWAGSVIIGNSQTGHQNMIAIKLTNPNFPDNNKKNLLVIGSVYAKDIPAVNATYLWMKELLQNAEQAPYQQFLQQFNILIIPTLNPDGMDYVLNHSLYELLSNTRDLNSNNIFDPESDGVNLNRNTGFNWVHGDSYANSGSNQYYRGNQAYSEKEMQALQQLLNEEKIEFSVMNITDTDSNFKVVYPYNWAQLRPSPDYIPFNMLSENISNAMNVIDNQWSAQANTKRNANLSDELYVNYGITPITFSFEDYSVLPDSSALYHLKNQFQAGIQAFMNHLINYQDVTSNKPGLLELLVIDNQNNSPLAAEIRIDQKHSNAFKRNLSNAENGCYYRFLDEGNYTITVQKKGFNPSVQNISIGNNQHLNLQVVLERLAPAQINIHLSLNNETAQGRIRIQKDHYEETIEVNGSAVFETYEGQHEFTLLSDELAPMKKSVYIHSGINEINFDLDYTNHSFTEEFESSCCSWIMNGPWLVVSDSTHNSQFITDSWSGNGFYEVNANYDIKISYPISLFGYDDQDVYLTFDHSVYTEWENDYVTVELSYDNISWSSIYKFAGNTEGWQKQVLSLNGFKNHDVYLRFCLKDGIEGNPNHTDLVDPGWNLDNIKVIASTSQLDNQDVITQIQKTALHTYPNPFNPTLNISFSSKDIIQKAELKIFNIKGQLVEKQYLNPEQIRQKNMVWNANKMASGIYFIQLNINNHETIMKKTLLLK